MADERVHFRIYNTMTGKKEIFKPKIPNKVSMYVCGVTTYDYSHLGHARAAVSFDILFRYLKHLGYEVTYVRNFTDIDDKIIDRANKNGEEPLMLSKRFCDEYHIDMFDLQCEKPSIEPCVSDHIEEIKDMITQIINNGCAYEVDGSVYFAVDKYPSYCMLSGQRLDHNRAGGRVAVDPKKKCQHDFALWKAAKPGEPSWDSPWGPGRPGWHIECSAMSARYLSHKFDIHGGGRDLLFPHHDNEIAQSWAVDNESNVSYWVHNGHVTVDNEKMSKSLGNFWTVREITRSYHPLALRHFLITTSNYGSDLNYTEKELNKSSYPIYVIFETLRECNDALSSYLQGDFEKDENVAQISKEAKKCIKELNIEFETNMSDDLQTKAILDGAFREALSFIKVSLKELKKSKQLQLVQSLLEVQKEVRKVLNVLGLLPSHSYAEVVEELKDKALKRAGLTEDEVLHLIEERNKHRKKREYAKADKIRDDLNAKGIGIQDLMEEAVTIWTPGVPPSLQKRVV